MQMKSKAALLAAGAAIAPMPRAIAGSRVRMDATDPKLLIEQIQAAVKEMRDTNDQRLSKIESKVDPLDVAKFDTISASVDKLHAALDEQATKIAALTINGAGIGDLPATDPEYVNAFKAHMRKGDHVDASVRASLNKGTDSQGGYLAPVEWDRTITNKLKRVSKIRENAMVQDITGPGFKKLFNDRSVGSGWVGETASRPTTTTPGFGMLDFTTGEIYANPAISQQLLDDAAVDLEQWLASEVDTEFSRQEGIAFLSGDGSNKPYGILTFVTGAANAARHPWGDILVTNTGNANLLTGDGFIDLMYSLPGEFTGNAKLFLNRLSMGAVRKLKDGQGSYLWQPAYALGQPQTLNSSPIVELPDMPTVAAGNIVALYGDMEATYMVVDRLGIRVLRDPFTDKPFVHFYSTRRVGGGVYNPEPMKALKVSA